MWEWLGAQPLTTPGRHRPKGAVGSVQPQGCLWPWALSQAFLDWDRASDTTLPNPHLLALDSCLIEALFISMFPSSFETDKWVRPTDSPEAQQKKGPWEEESTRVCSLVLREAVQGGTSERARLRSFPVRWLCSISFYFHPI